MSQFTSPLVPAGESTPPPAVDPRPHSYVFPVVREIVASPPDAPSADRLQRRSQAHARERERVVASLLAAPAAGRATHRRWA
jgi:hypothetical protein